MRQQTKAIAQWHIIGGKRHYFKSRLEAKWAKYLQLLKMGNVIEDWFYEPDTFWFPGIKRGTVSYKPDFLVRFADGSIELHETKGYLTAKDITKFKRMQKYYPGRKLILILQARSKKRVNLRRAAEKYVERIVVASDIFGQLKGII